MRRVEGLLCFVLAGCAGCAGLDARYVSADRLTHDAVAPEYRRYVAEDEALDDEQRERRFRTLEAWAARLAEAEGGGR